MNEQETEYTIFARWNDGSSSHGKRCYFPKFDNEPQGLAERIEFVRNFMSEDSFAPFAWTTESVDLNSFEAEIEASIAAGRLIEKAASGWVALGAEKQEAEAIYEEIGRQFVEACGATKTVYKRVSRTPTLDKLERELRKGEPTSADLAMIARDDTAAARRQAETRKYLDQVEQMLAATLPSTAKPNPFQNYTAPDCDSGPSDHLNASRHQMAGMKG